MPSITTSHRHQKAVLYIANGTDRNGEVKVDPPIEIDVRWQTVRKEITDTLGNTIELDSQAVVSQLIPIDSLMWLGKLLELPSPVTNLRQVKVYTEVSDMRNRGIRRVVGLAKYSDTVAATA